jgi:hypothetical protein
MNMHEVHGRPASNDYLLAHCSFKLRFISIFTTNTGKSLNHEKITPVPFMNGFRHGLVFRHQRDVI